MRPMPSASAKAEGASDETFWVGELPVGAVERRVCFSSSEPFRPIAQVAAEPRSFVFVASVLAQGWTQKPASGQRNVGSLYVSVVEPIRGDSLRPPTMIAIPIDAPACAPDGGATCVDWNALGPGTTLIVGCSDASAHAAKGNALAPVAGPRATAVDDVKKIVKGKKP